MSSDDLGDRMKLYEMTEAGRKLMPLLPILVRLDGKGFSQFTKTLQKPFCPELHEAMVETTKFLIEKTHAKLGYTQSDEITLVYYSDDFKSQVIFDGRISKMNSILASMCSVKFNSLLTGSLADKAGSMPVFDCRAWNVPTKEECANAILWRERDATRNSVSMAAFTVFSPKELFGKSKIDQIQMLESKGIRWDEYPDAFKRGTFLRRQVICEAPTEEMKKHLESRKLEIPEQVMRSKVAAVAVPPFGKVVNRVEFIFDGADPVVGE